MVEILEGKMKNSLLIFMLRKRLEKIENSFYAYQLSPSEFVKRKARILSKISVLEKIK